MKNDNTYYRSVSVYGVESFYADTCHGWSASGAFCISNELHLCPVMSSILSMVQQEKIRLKNDILQFDKNLDLSTLPATI